MIFSVYLLYISHPPRFLLLGHLISPILKNYYEENLNFIKLHTFNKFVEQNCLSNYLSHMLWAYQVQPTSHSFMKIEQQVNSGNSKQCNYALICSSLSFHTLYAPQKIHTHCPEMIVNALISALLFPNWRVIEPDTQNNELVLLYNCTYQWAPLNHDSHVLTPWLWAESAKGCHFLSNPFIFLQQRFMELNKPNNNSVAPTMQYLKSMIPMKYWMTPLLW